MPFCSECGNECETNTVDEGIGSYEYWGSMCYDRHMVVISQCCEANVYKIKEEIDGVDVYSGLIEYEFGCDDYNDEDYRED